MATRLRADALRNRAALLTAAREVFAEQGLDASLDEIARRAGVGNATLYRRFPSRRHLIAAVFAGHLTAAVHLADQALEHSDPWAGFVGYLTRVCELQATDRGLAELLVTSAFDDDERIAALRGAARQRALDVCTRAQRAGRLRPDFTRHDITLLMMANAGVAQHSNDPQAWRRQLALVIGGLGTKTF
ncbi:TetR/AcrR family transcriptional regulator [Actinoplanes derwentensis]|uniref:DNA-binding transcriptional regulator, AcrR family n=1 Tax=Actinoplanes derwentensis TaxID=113562 RepID=A0A1H2CX51_9ACTN|nr:TetR/AcrR family transcriptional regulator [Actinoplanes derwentensis]SDT75088.1 DNA-binding transcriptional regulator, AcrR family [Actinoplanes derwentensis]